MIELGEMMCWTGHKTFGDNSRAVVVQECARARCSSRGIGNKEEGRTEETVEGSDRNGWSGTGGRRYIFA
jgi:hypothetical protein